MTYPNPQAEIVFDPVYVDRVAVEIVKVIGEAQRMIAAGNLGPDLIDLALHAKELHEILTEQLLQAPAAIVTRFSPTAVAIGQGIERLLAQVDGREPGSPMAH